MGLTWVNVSRGHIMHTYSDMCYGPCQYIHRPKQQQIGDIGEMGLPWMNVCRGHIMLTLAMCSGPLRDCCQVAMPGLRALVAHLPL